MLQQGLQQLGWSEGRNLHIEYRSFAGEAVRAQAMAKELVDLKPDLIIAVSTPGLVAAERETRTIPIVFVAVPDPVGQGFVTGLARPAATPPGSAFSSSRGRRGARAQADRAERGAVALPSIPTRCPSPFLRALDAVGPSLGGQLIKTPVRNATEIEAAIAATAREPGGVLMFCPTPSSLFIVT